MPNQINYWWNDDLEVGSYRFCDNEAGHFSFYLHEVDKFYTFGWTAEERNRKFEGAKFVWGGCMHGHAWSECPLKAETLEAAKNEFEAWYAGYLSTYIENLQHKIKQVQKQYNALLEYQQHRPIQEDDCNV